MKIITVPRLKLLFNIIISTLYAFRLASIPSDLLSDRANYTIYYKYAIERLSDSSGVLSLMTMEPLYYMFNIILAFLGNPNFALQSLSFFICFSFCFFALNHIKHWHYSLLFLLLSLFNLNLLSLQLNALRQGTALSLLLFFFQFRKDVSYKSLIAFCFILGLVHLSFFLVGSLLIVDWWLTRKQSNLTQYKRIIGLTIASILLSLFALTIMRVTGASQASTYEEGGAKVSGFGFIYWLVFLTYILIMKPKKYRSVKMDFMYSIVIIIFIYYLASYFFMPIFGRLLSTALPFAIYILLYKPRAEDILFVFLLLIQSIFIFFYTNNFNIYIFMSKSEFFKHILCSL